MTKKHAILVIANAAAALIAWSGRAIAQAGTASAGQTATLFQNVRIFDGHSATLSPPSNVLVRGDTIARISTAAIPVDRSMRVIDGHGRTLMPGLIDAHWHALFVAAPLQVLLTADVGYLNLVAGQEATRTLMRGFTSVRDVAGPAFGLKRAIDEGALPGPRIWPSGAMISQTSGHGDFRMFNEIPREPNAPLSHGEQVGASAIADSPDEVRLRTREQLMLGASQIKLAAGGGVSSAHDPLDATQYTEAEVHAAVEAAANWGTYVTVHAYTPDAIEMAIRAGVKCIEHGHLMDETAARMMAEKGIWLSIQPFLDNEFAHTMKTPESQKQLEEVYAGTDRAYALAKKYKLKTAWGTDMLFDPANTKNQGAILTTMTRWYTPAEVLTMATSTNAELLALSGPRNPYPGKLGVVEEGALADLLLVDGDPIANLKLIADPEKNLLVIMKGGTIYKDVLERGP